jgi:outer membrane autotransporter protein
MGDYYYPEQMVPQAAAASMQVNRILAQQAMKRASLRLRQCDLSSDDQEVNQIYAVPFFGWGSQDGEALAMGFDWTARGMDIGFQRRLSPAITAGLNLDFHEAEADCDHGGGDATISGLGITPFAVFMREDWRVHGGARYSRADTSANRPLWMTGTTARANYYAESWGAWAEVDHDFRLADRVTLMPLLNVNWVHMVEVGVDESGAYLLNSYLQLGDYHSLRHLLGATFAVSSDIGLAEGLRLQFTAGWRHDYLDTQTRSDAELAATTRVLEGPDSGSDALAVDLQVNCPLPWGMSLELAYTGDYSQNANVQSVLLWIVASF